MRRRDKAAAILGWALLLAGLAWALSTQSRWVRENRPLVPRGGPLKEGATAGARAPTTGVIGPVSEGTREALLQELKVQNARRRERASTEKPTPPRSRPSGSGSR